MIDTTSVTVGLPVADLEEAIRWYARLLDAGPDIEPVEGVVEFEVRDGFWLQLFEGTGGSGEAVIRSRGPGYRGSARATGGHRSRGW